MLQIKPSANKNSGVPSAAVWRRARRFGWAGIAFVAVAWWLNATGAADPLEQAAGVPQPATVERVVDGDTLRVVLDSGGLATLRLLAIDAPESGQEGGAEAREFVAARVCGAAVRWRSHGRDRYGRTVASVEVDGEDLGVLLVRAGLAWRVKRYLEDAPAELREAYESAWREARAARRGLWAGDPQPPWEWRRTNRPASGHSVLCSGRAA